MSLEQIREQIREHTQEQAAIIAQPVSRADVERCVRDVVQDVATDCNHLHRLAAGAPAPLLRVRADDAVDLLPIFIRMMGAAAVTKALLRGLDDIPEGLAPAAREARLAAIVEELATLGHAEEALCRSEGHARRPDADPACVLALQP